MNKLENKNIYFYISDSLKKISNKKNYSSFKLHLWLSFLELNFKFKSLNNVNILRILAYIFK